MFVRGLEWTMPCAVQMAFPWATWIATAVQMDSANPLHTLVKILSLRTSCKRW